MAFPEAWLNELMSKNDIASVVSEFVELKPRGGRLWGHCPFHTDKTPSFSVTPDKQLFHCFSCKAGGSVIQFIMQAENLSYIDAVRRLAERAGMNMPEEIDDRKLIEQKLRREKIFEANREAANFYYKALFSEKGGGARRYLMNRGVNADTAKKFGLGFSPDGFDVLYKYLTEKGFSRETLFDAGLIVKGRKDPDRVYDFFRGRLMFPVVSASGRVIAFGGRTMDNDEPKYINTGDTPVYNKRDNIYAINLLKGKKLDDVIMVEGYMDVISLHQAGIENAIASLGTALTSQQARLLKRYASKVYYAYDGDEAGQKAMIKGIDVLRASQIDPRVIIIPGGHDPDEFIKMNGKDEFLALKDASITGIRFKLGRIALENGVDTADGRQSFAVEACSLISKLEPVERDRYIPIVAELSGLPQETVREQCGAAIKAENENGALPRPISFKRPKKDTERIKAEKKLLSCMMQSPDAGIAIGRSGKFSLMLFSSKPMQTFAAGLLAAYNTAGRADIPLMIASLEAADAEDISSAYAQSDEIDSPVRCADDILESLAMQTIRADVEQLSQKIKEASDENEKKKLMDAYRLKYAELQNLVKLRSGS